MAKKRKYKHGNHMFERDGWYWATVDGRRVSLKTQNQDEANKAYERLTAGEDIRRKPIAFSGAVNEYCNTQAFLKDLAITTQARHTFCFDKFLIPYFKIRAISKIRPSDVSRYIEERKSASAASNTILKELTALSACLSWCVEQDYIAYNPVLQVKKKPKKTDLVRPNYTPSEDEINKVLAKLHKRVVTFFLVLCNTGARADELRGTNISDLDSDLGTLRVIRKGGKEDFLVLNDIAKNRITDDLLARALKRDLQSDEPLFLNRYGTRLLSIKRAIKFACERADVPHMTHHSLRHGYATILYEQGLKAEDVANLLGNSLEVCMAIYVKWRDRKKMALARNYQIGTKFVQTTESVQSEDS